MQCIDDHILILLSIIRRTGTRNDDTYLCCQVHDRCGAPGARDHEEEGHAQTVPVHHRRNVQEQYGHASSSHQRQPDATCHTPHHPLLLLPQQHTYRYDRCVCVCVLKCVRRRKMNCLYVWSEWRC